MLLINTSNLHTGGAIQVATSFIWELSQMAADFSQLHVVVSSEVDASLARLNTPKEVFGHYAVINTYGLSALTSSLNKEIAHYSTVFTIFGPNYLRAQAPREIVGFAQPWITSPLEPQSIGMPFLQGLVTRLKFFAQWIFFLRADHYIVELEHIKDGLIRKRRVPASKISVVHNSAGSVYLNSSQWQSVEIRKKAGAIALGFATRDYPHKNIKILPLVADTLLKKHGLDVHFYLTLKQEEYEIKDTLFKNHVSAVGELFPDECPSFYSQMDGVVFPSLLECFSATPLEAMMMRKPLFASDRGFVRDICGDHAIYFDPSNPEDIAAKIAAYFNKASTPQIDLDKAAAHARDFSSAADRAKKYIEIISQHH